MQRRCALRGRGINEREVVGVELLRVRKAKTEYADRRTVHDEWRRNEGFAECRSSAQFRIALVPVGDGTDNDALTSACSFWCGRLVSQLHRLPALDDVVGIADDATQRHVLGLGVDRPDAPRDRADQ